MKKNHFIVKVVLIILVILFFTVAIPVGINESYKQGVGYVTMWCAADVLSYYGAILASGGAVIGVYLSIAAAQKNYQEDVRSRVLPFIAVTPLEHKISIDMMSLLFGQENEENPEEGKRPDYQEYKLGRYYYVISSDKILIQKELDERQKKILCNAGKIWVSSGSGQSLQTVPYMSLPLEIENVGNGTAVNLRIGFNRNDVVPGQFIPPRMLKLDETIYVHIFSSEDFEKIKGEYTLEFYYEDIYGNKYNQQFPITIGIKAGKGMCSIELIGKQKPCTGDDPYAHT